jgi:AraC-like DNA-binding protein
MTEAITPIFIEDNLIGFVMIGQFRTSAKKIPAVIQKAWKKKNATDELEKAFLETPYYDPEHFNNILTLFSVLVDFIVSKRLIEVKGTSSVQPIVTFMMNHLEENLSVTQAAKILSQSRSSFSHKFKQLTGKSFKQFQIDLKLDKADELFKSNPELNINEISLRLGFDDPFYFSRLYKKYRGKSPSSTKKKISRKIPRP